MNHPSDAPQADAPPDAYTHVGRRLRQVRTERGLSQANVAGVLSVSPQQYQKYEDAQSKCSLNYLIALADFYEISVNEFLPDTAVPQPAPEPSEPMVEEADLLARLVTAFVRLNDPGEKLRLVQLVEAIVASNDRLQSGGG